MMKTELKRGKAKKPRPHRADPPRHMNMTVIRIYTAEDSSWHACRLAHDAIEHIRASAEVPELTFWERPVRVKKGHPNWDGEAAELCLGEA